jgi:hypothetical protein
MKVPGQFVLTLLVLCTPVLSHAQKGQHENSIGDSLNFIEKVWLHADRDRYNTGDDIWFKAYLVDGSNMLTDNSFNLHVELIAPKQKIVDSRIIRLTDGLGNGDFKLSDNLHSGLYHLRAYTNFMRNYDSRYFFNKEVMIINPADSGKMYGDSISYVKNKIEAGFFPEGGSLVDDVSSVVAFKATDASGKSCDVSGEIFSSSGELVLKINSTHKGMGKFSITPDRGKKYFAVFYNHLGDTTIADLPKSFPEGLVLNISDNSEGFIDLTIKTNTVTLQQFSGRDLFLTVSAQNTEYKSISFRMKTINSKMNLTSEDIPDGIVKIKISGPDNKPLCERLIFIQNKKNINVHLETNKPVYKQRDSVSVSLSLAENTGAGGNAWLSLAAVNNISLDNTSGYPSTISSWFLLESDIRGIVEDPGYYFDMSNAERLKDLDLLLLTQGWRDFQWKYRDSYYLPEIGFSLSGRARKKFADEPVSNSNINIGIFKKGKPLITSVPTDSAGKFHLENVEITGEAKLIASITGDNDKLKGWLILDSMNYLPAPLLIMENRRGLLHSEYLPDSVNKTDKSLPSYIQYAEYKRSVQKKYKLSDTINVGEVTITARRQIKPESPQDRNQRYLMTRWPDTEYKIEPESKIYNNIGFLLKNKFRIISADDPSNSPVLPRLAESSGSHQSAMGASQGLSLEASLKAGKSTFRGRRPIFLLDGMIVDWESVAFLPIDWVERIDMLDPRHGELIWGDRGKDGVISVITKPWSEQNIKLYHSVNISIRGYYEPRVFYSPKHHTTLEKDYKPDMRTTLFWEPNIKLEENKEVILSYFNADNPATVRIIVEGMTTSGIPVTGIAGYEVK